MAIVIVRKPLASVPSCTAQAREMSGPRVDSGPKCWHLSVPRGRFLVMAYRFGKRLLNYTTHPLLGQRIGQAFYGNDPGHFGGLGRLFQVAHLTKSFEYATIAPQLNTGTFQWGRKDDPEKPRQPAQTVWGVTPIRQSATGARPGFLPGARQRVFEGRVRTAPGFPNVRRAWHSGTKAAQVVEA